MERALQADKAAADFLQRAGWRGAKIEQMVGDYSQRRFMRLARGGRRVLKNAILMQAAPDQKTAAYVTISGLLRGADLHAPEIYVADVSGSAYDFILMEDLGDTTFGAQLDRGRAPDPYDRRAVDVLVRLHEVLGPRDLEPAGLPHFNAALFGDQARLFLDFYWPCRFGCPAPQAVRQAFDAAMGALLAPLDGGAESLLLRDYMPDNIMDLGGTGAASAGLIDFQDGGCGSIAYDLVSLCEVVRRPGGNQRLQAALRHYLAARDGLDTDALHYAVHVLGAQRHIRILGIFARYGKLDILERVEAHLTTWLLHPDLGPLRAFFDDHVWGRAA